MKSKKGSLSLSVNAIVVLILAITMLGLGLGFINKMFGDISQQMEEKISQEAEPPTPSSRNPITLSRESLITNAGDAEVLKVGIHNPTDGEWTSQAPWIDCGSSSLDLLNSFAVNTKTVGVGESAVYVLQISVPDGAVADTYLCKVQMPCDAPAPGGDCTTTAEYYKDLTVTVKA